ncbi:MAG: FAD binding domain-containing protein [Chloroflexia bacterium]
MGLVNWTAYLFPESVEEALEMLSAHAGRARLIAGGTDLVLQAQRGQCPAEVMVDITRIPGLDFLEEREGWIWIGPQVTHGQIAASPLIREKAGLLARACGCVGGPQIRHVGTLVGNVVNAMPAADGAVALFALDAEVEVADLAGRRFFPIAELYAGVGRSRVDPAAQMVTAIRFPALPAGSGWAYKRLAQRKALILPMLNVAVVVEVEAGRFRRARIALGPVAPTPLRARAAEEALQGAPVSEEAVAEAARLAQEAASPRDSVIRGSAEYRKAMVGVLVRRALWEAVPSPLTPCPLSPLPLGEGRGGRG